MNAAVPMVDVIREPLAPTLLVRELVVLVPQDLLETHVLVLFIVLLPSLVIRVMIIKVLDLHRYQRMRH